MSGFNDYAVGAWQGARAAADHNLAELDQANANIDYLNRVTGQQQAQIAALQARITAMATQVALAEADAAGARAQVRAFNEAHPDSNLRVDSGRRYRDGDVKRVSTLVYEAAFDAKARELGISNPEQHRAD